MSKTKTEVEIIKLMQGQMKFCIVGNSPLIMNSLLGHGARDLLCPPPKKTIAERATTSKHDPLREFQESMYVARDSKSVTMLEFPSSAFKRAMAQAAMDMGGKKSVIGRQAWAVGVTVPVYGVPQMSMMTVRNSDMKRTPDVRIRAILPEWACEIDMRYAVPQLNEKKVANFLAGAGVICGVGDGRVEKGALSFGQFRLVDGDDTDLLRIKKQARAQQESAYREPDMYDRDTGVLYEYWKESERSAGRIQEEEVVQ